MIGASEEWASLLPSRESKWIPPESLLNSRLGGALRREQVVGHDEAHEDDDDGQDPEELLPAGTLPAAGGLAGCRLQGVCKALSLMQRLSSRELGLLSRTRPVRHVTTSGS